MKQNEDKLIHWVKYTGDFTETYCGAKTDPSDYRISFEDKTCIKCLKMASKKEEFNYGSHLIKDVIKKLEYEQDFQNIIKE